MSHAALHPKGLLSLDPFRSVMAELCIGDKFLAGCLYKWILRVEFSGGGGVGLLGAEIPRLKFLQCNVVCLD